jgi:hypothetical protein
LTESVVVYTASFGERRDKFLEPKCFDSTCDWFYFTDTDFRSERWIPNRVATPEDPQRYARKFKLQPHYIFPNHDVSVWIDANISPLLPVRDLVDQYLKHTDIALHRHQDRKTVAQELQACIKLEKDTPEVMQKQLQEYVKNGYTEMGILVETGVILRRHTPEVNAMCDSWWAEVESKSVRDQLSANYCLQEHGLVYDVLPEHVRQSSIFHYEQHS